MNNDRRRFIGAAGMIGIASALLPTQVFAGRGLASNDAHSRRRFEARINDWFWLRSADYAEQSDLELIDVADEGTCKDLEQFALTLRSSRMDVAIPSGHYSVVGEGFDIFVKHTHEQGGRQLYRAEFCLLQAGQ